MRFQEIAQSTGYDRSDRPTLASGLGRTQRTQRGTATDRYSPNARCSISHRETTSCSSTQSNTKRGAYVEAMKSQTCPASQYGLQNTLASKPQLAYFGMSRHFWRAQRMPEVRSKLLLSRTTIVGTLTVVFHCNNRPAADRVADAWLEDCAYALDRTVVLGTAC